MADFEVAEGVLSFEVLNSDEFAIGADILFQRLGDDFFCQRVGEDFFCQRPTDDLIFSRDH